MVSSFISALLFAGVQTASPCKVSMSLSPVEPLTEASFISAVREQVRLGIESNTISVKWSEISSQNLKPLADQLGICQLIGGDVVFVLKPIDTSNRTTPESLQNIRFDSPELISQWEDTLLAVAKALPKSTKVIAIGNEVDVYLSEHPEQVDGFLNLIKQSRALLKGAGIQASLGTVTTFEGLRKRPELVKKIQSSFEVVMMTYYPINDSFQVLPAETVPSHFDQMVKFADNRPLILTEMGYPSGSANGSSEDAQAEFVKQVFISLKKHEKRIPYANYFNQTDWGNTFLDFFETYYQLKDERFRSFLGTLGLTKTDGTRKKSFAEFKRQIRLFNGE